MRDGDDRDRLTARRDRRAVGGGHLRSDLAHRLQRSQRTAIPVAGARRETVIVTGSGNNFTVEMSQMAGTMLRRQSGTVTTTTGGTQFTFTPTCPLGGDSGGTVDYSVSGSTFTVYDLTSTGILRLDVYTKRSRARDARRARRGAINLGNVDALDDASCARSFINVP